MEVIYFGLRKNMASVCDESSINSQLIIYAQILEHLSSERKNEPCIVPAVGDKGWLNQYKITFVNGEINDVLSSRASFCRFLKTNGATSQRIRKVAESVLSTKLKNQGWFDAANQPVSAENSALTLVIDLDSVVIEGTRITESSRFTQAKKLSFFAGVDIDICIDVNAFAQLKQLISNGHNVKVITNRRMQVAGIINLFAEHGVNLAESDVLSNWGLSHPLGVEKSIQHTFFKSDLAKHFSREVLLQDVTMEQLLSSMDKEQILNLVVTVPYSDGMSKLDVLAYLEKNLKKRPLENLLCKHRLGINLTVEQLRSFSTNPAMLCRIMVMSNELSSQLPECMFQLTTALAPFPLQLSIT
ncbi:MAG: hypothetical protein ACPGUD_00185 [Parashewanella sp.]